MFIITRSEENPILSPRRDHPWEASAAFNWSPVKDGKLTHVVYRAMSNRQLLEDPQINRSIIGRATTTDGITFTDRAPFIVSDHDFDRYGCEDARVTKFGDTYYIFYTALSNFPFSADGIKVAVALSRDMKTITEKHLVTPFNAKAMVLFPEKINGQYVVMFTLHSDLPDTNIAIAAFDKLEDMWSQDYWHTWYEHRDANIINFHRTNDDQVELGAQPVKTADGWLLIYSHATHYFSNPNHCFGVEAVLLDLTDLRMIKGRTKGSFFSAEHYYEQTGLVPHVVFPSGAMVRGEYLDIYYGAADTHCAIASVRLNDLMQSILPSAPKLLTRFPNNPLLVSRKNKDWEAHGVLNPAAIEYEGKVYLFYRAMGSDDTSTFGMAVSADGITIDERSDKPVYSGRIDIEQRHQAGNCGVEDPRIVYMKRRFYMTYTAYDGFTPRIVITSISEEDFAARKWKQWTTPEVLTPSNTPNKDSTFIPEKFTAGYAFFHRVNTSVCLDFLPSLDFSANKISRCIEIISPRAGMWDARKVGLACPAIKTKAGWLTLYHGISETGTYRVGAVLLDLKDPTIVLSRSAIPLFEPEEQYEIHGVVSRVVFPCGVVKRGDKLFFYYGGADNVVGGATAKLSHILERLTPFA